MDTSNLLEVSEKNLELLKAFAFKNDLNLNQAVNAIIEAFLSKKKSENELVSEKEEDVTLSIIDFYKKMYRKRFQLVNDEEINYKSVDKFVKTLIENIEDEKAAIEILQKAIIWYIFFHKNTNKDGVHFNSSLYMLTSQVWLFKSCVEQSSSYSLEVLLQAVKSGIELEGLKELNKFSRSGDSGKEQGNETKSLQAVLLEIEDLVDEIGEEVREVTAFEALYKGNPGKEEILEAKRIIEMIRKKLNGKK